MTNKKLVMLPREATQEMMDSMETSAGYIFKVPGPAYNTYNIGIDKEKCGDIYNAMVRAYEIALLSEMYVGNNTADSIVNEDATLRHILTASLLAPMSLTDQVSRVLPTSVKCWTKADEELYQQLSRKKSTVLEDLYTALLEMLNRETVLEDKDKDKDAVIKFLLRNAPKISDLLESVPHGVRS